MNRFNGVSIGVSLAVFALAGGCKLQVGEADDDATGGESAERDRDREEATGGTTSAPPPSTATAGSASPSAPPPNTSGGTASPSTPPPNTSGSTGVREDCGVPEAIDNEDRDHAQPLGSSATICVDDDDDEDWFYIDAPDDGKAHVIRLDVEQTAEAHLGVAVYADKDDSEITHTSFDLGVTDALHLTVAPGSRTLLDFYEYGTSRGLITLKTSLTAEQDENEPNNDRDGARTISAGSEVHGQILVPYLTAEDRESADWYRIQLKAGPHVLHLTQVPELVWLGVWISDANRVDVDWDRPPNAGALFDFEFEVPADGTYYFEVDNYPAELSVAVQGDPETYLSEGYVFNIE
jgi:hypothetical protein